MSRVRSRKMAIVPYKLWEEMKKWKQESRPKLPADPQVVTTVQLQRDLARVLDNEQLSESEKADLYGQTLFRFQEAFKKAKQQQHQSTTPQIPQMPTQSPESIQPSSQQPQHSMDVSASRLSTERVLESVPKTMRQKAQLLMNFLDSSKINWDAQGRVSVEGKHIHGSNIVDLVNDVLRHRKTFDPKGWQPFAQELAKMNIPQDIVGNPKRWQWMQNQDDPEDNNRDVYASSEPMDTPRTPRSKQLETPPDTVKTIKRKSSSKATSKRVDDTPVRHWLKW